MAFNAKNLTYDKSEPAFLQRLKAGYAAQDGRNNIQHARPGKSRLNMGDGDEDDGPIILDESGEVIEKGVYEGMMKGKVEDDGITGNDINDSSTNGLGDGSAEKNGQEAEESQAGDREKQQVADIGTSKKRKAIKVVGDDRYDEKIAPDQPLPESKTDLGSKSRHGKKSIVEKPKKKGKKIKLSFDDPE